MLLAWHFFVIACFLGNSDSFAFWEDDLTYEGESVYNYLQVKENEKEVYLSTNVLFGVQSVYEKSDELTGMYYDYAMAAPLMAGVNTKDNLDVLILGMGTGTFATQCDRYFDGMTMEGVEIDEDITKLPMFKRSQKGVGYLAQEASVFRHMTVEDNIMSVMEMSKQFTKEERKARLESLLDEFNLHKVRKSKGIQLSGGERRRCEIARALAIDPKFILLDEPFAGVDPIAVEDIQYIIAKLKYKNIGVIITDHNVGETLAIIDRAYLLYEGSILQSGTPEELAADEEVRTKYLGSTFVLKRSAAFLRAEAGGPQRINNAAEHAEAVEKGHLNASTLEK